MTASGTTNENDTVHFKEWMIVILSMTKRDALLQRIDDCNLSGLPRKYLVLISRCCQKLSVPYNP